MPPHKSVCWIGCCCPGYHYSLISTAPGPYRRRQTTSPNRLIPQPGLSFHLQGQSPVVPPVSFSSDHRLHSRSPLTLYVLSLTFILRHSRLISCACKYTPHHLLGRYNHTVRIFALVFSQLICFRCPPPLHPFPDSRIYPVHLVLL